MFRFTIRDLLWLMVVVGLLTFIVIDLMADMHRRQQLQLQLAKMGLENSQLRQELDGFRAAKYAPSHVDAP